jgi:hypothetical protein
MSVTACLPGVQVVRPEGAISPLPLPTVMPMLHNVAVVGVDFDPPLSADVELHNGVTLLIAVANQGLSTEQVVNVTARLLDPLAEGGGEDLQQETVILRNLAPDEVRIVRLAAVNALPPRSRYQLVVQIAPLNDEGELGDNIQTYDVLVGEAE